ncbi:TK/SFK-SRC protein kinase [Salpingoeca rosetta]|uniref:non-specific protein-tyrosine kinase n=1 Tax=Salpingoeca rosetta (strain ATCC 50818 / BSB-021) TaxID=946362 RepID=F2U842_SALR5|nr:TK/SFK-SRC protein kinase [Salpingoeca rosetta]EGD72947.1 TK/SFK-SRC protein kinase [Salpingoeca rosetta]|eukprot:XP_004994769.1 TK/SFK-SRC protein kinase [Salpingoeca rosetta]
MSKPASDAPRLNTGKRGKRSRGFLKLCVYFDTASSFLVADVKEARALPKPALAYVKCYIMPEKKVTKQKTIVVKEKTTSPEFEEVLRWPINDPREYRERLLEVDVWDKAARSGFIGRFSIKIADVLPPTDKLEGWFELLDSDKGSSQYHLVEPDTSRDDLVTALYDNIPRGPGELFMRKGDMLYQHETEGAWCRVENAITGDEGYVPASFVVKANSLESEPWFFGPITRAKAEKLLGSPLRKHGTYLIRESESAPGTYSLSMKDGDAVRHFRIKVVDGKKLRIQGSPSAPHDDLRSLVKFHQKSRCGLSTRLKTPCPREQPARAADLAYNVKDEWEVDRDTVDLKKQLGEGQYGEVYYAIWNGVTECAVKTLKTHTTSPDEFLKEAQLMKKLKHDNLVRLYAVCSIGEPIFIITEFMKNGALLEYLKTPAGEALRLPTLIDMGTDIAQGMAYLERNNYIHRDLAARNILVGDNNVCKVADFGLARVLEDGEFRPENLEKFPVRWTAPEAMKHNRYSTKSDVWSFGILLSEIITYGRKPYHGMSNKEVVGKLDSGFRMECPPGCPDSLYKIMLDCWKSEPADRPTFEALVFRLEDFFHGDMQYAEASQVLGDDDDDDDSGDKK